MTFENVSLKEDSVMDGTLLEIKTQKGLIYSITLGNKEGSEPDDLREIMEVIRIHLDAVEQSGGKLELKLFRT